MIPRLLHQTAKTADIPERWQAYQRKLIALHPEWTYRLWTDADNDAFVRQEYPDFYSTFLKLPRNIMRADVIRYLLMYKLGGLYMDLDYEMLKPFDLTDHDLVLPWESEGDHGQGNDKICNSIFASAPGHPLFKLAIDDLQARPPLSEGLDVEEVTGPMFLTRIYHQAKAAGIRAHMPPRTLFSPRTPQNARQYQAIIDDGIAYGIHHCDGSWRNYSWSQRLKRRVSRVIKKALP